MNRRGAIKFLLLAMLPCSLLGAGATSRPANPAPPDTSIQVAAPKEVEFRDESRDDNGKPRQIILDLTGQSMKGAVAYANFRIEQAIDDAGEDLADSDDPVLFSNTHIKKTEQYRRSNGAPLIKVRALFRAPSRHATTFVRFKGQVQVMTLSDESRSIIIPRLASYIAHRPEVKALRKEKLGLQTGFAHYNGHDDHRYVYVWTYGNPVIVRKAQIIDDNGQLIADGLIDDDYDMINSRQYSLGQLPRNVDDRMSLKLEIAAGQKVITVPFDLRNMSLP